MTESDCDEQGAPEQVGPDAGLLDLDGQAGMAHLPGIQQQAGLTGADRSVLDWGMTGKAMARIARLISEQVIRRRRVMT